MNFGGALNAMEQGYRVARAGWNGKDMWICLGQGQARVPAENLWNVHTKAFALEHGGSAEVLPYFIMKTADNKILMGWLASQTDMVAKDWEIVPNGEWNIQLQEQARRERARQLQREGGEF